MAKILFFQQLNSTNTYAEQLDLSTLEDGTVIWAIEQTCGIGQKGNSWESNSGENLTFSIILKPTFLSIQNQFMISKVLSLGILDYLSSLLPKSRIHIKWPNDIYVDRCKICGILVSNSITGSTYAAAIGGIGFNVNQTCFTSAAKNAVSLQMLLQTSFNLKTILEKLLSCIENRYSQLKAKQFEQLNQEYLNNLLYFKSIQPYYYKEKLISATIKDVDDYGHLVLISNENNIITCDLKELTYIVNA